MSAFSIRSLLTVRRGIALLVSAALALGLFAWQRDTGSTVVHAYFSSAEGLHVGNEVKVLGVRVGEVTDIDNRQQGVYVTMSVDSGRPIPADASALIVSPSLVSGRFVQFEPVYTQGARLADGAVIGLEKTAVPVTFDDVKQQLIDLATTLGPTKDQPDGQLAVTIKAIDEGLRNGNSTDLRQAITELRGAATALSDGRTGLFSTVENLNTFTKTLAVNDAAVRGFTTELDEVSSVLASNRENLGGALRDLGVMLGALDKYLDKHRGRIKKSVGQLNTLSAVLADRSNELAGILHIAPFPIIGLSNTIQNQAITGRATLTGLESAAQLLCGAILGVGGSSQQCSDALQPLLGLLGINKAGGNQ